MTQLKHDRSFSGLSDFSLIRLCHAYLIERVFVKKYVP